MRRNNRNSGSSSNVLRKQLMKTLHQVHYSSHRVQNHRSGINLASYESRENSGTMANRAVAAASNYFSLWVSRGHGYWERSAQLTPVDVPVSLFCNLVCLLTFSSGLSFVYCAYIIFCHLILFTPSIPFYALSFSSIFLFCFSFVCRCLDFKDAPAYFVAALNFSVSFFY